MNKLYKKVSGTFFIKVLGLGFAFIFQIILGRMLQVETYGQYTLIITYVNIFLIIPVLGMDRNLIKEIAKIFDDKLQSKSLLSFSIKLSSCIFVLLTIFIIVFQDVLNMPNNTLSMFLLILFIRVIIMIFDGFLQGCGLVVKVTLLNDLFNNFLKIVFFTIFFIFKLSGLKAALYAFIISESIVLVLRIVTTKKLIGTPITFKEKIDSKYKNKFIKYSINVALISGIGLLLQNVDKVMIANFIDFKSVGIYKVSQNYVALIGVFVSPFIAFWPVISKLYNQNKILEIENNMKKIVKIVTYLVIPMFFIFLFLNENLLLIFGKVYITQKSKRVLIILAFAFLFDAISGPIGSILTMTKHAKYALFNNIICLFLNIIFNFIFIKKFGVIGVAIGTAISMIASNLISIIEVKMLLNIFSYDYKNIIQIVGLGIINFLLSIWLKNIIDLSNNYIYIIVFSGSLYIFNLLIIFFINRKILIEKFSTKKVRQV